MGPLHGNHHCMFVAIMILLLSVRSHGTNVCTNDTEEWPDMLFISGGSNGSSASFTSNAEEETQVRFCFCSNMHVNATSEECCCSPHFNCSVAVTYQDENSTGFTASGTLSKQDIGLTAELPAHFLCVPTSYNEKGFFWKSHHDLKMGIQIVSLQHQALDGLGGDALHNNSGWSFTSLRISTSLNFSSCVLTKEHRTGWQGGTTTAGPVQSTDGVTPPFSNDTGWQGGTTTAGPVQNTDVVTPPFSNDTSGEGGTTTAGPVQSTDGVTRPFSNDTGWQGGTTTAGPVQSTDVVTPPFSNDTSGEGGTSITVPVRDGDEVTSPEKAANLMKNLSFLVEQMGNASTAAVTIGQVRGVITRVPPRKQPGLYFHRVASGDVHKWDEKGPLEPADTHSVSIPPQAAAMAAERNGSFAAVMFFPEMYQDDPTSAFLYNQVVGIEMGVQIQNVSESITIEFNGVTENGSIFSCRSWDGEGGTPVWITDGCRTHQTNGSVSCLCSHLTFFAILMSPPPGNMSASDLRSLTRITSSGCGLSLIFLLLALSMHCLIRRGKANLSTQILVQLLVATSTLNLSFLVNESIGCLGHFGACVAIAALLHYSLLATFTWFLVQALHLFLSFHSVPSGVALYFEKICVAGWVTPAVVVIPLLGLQKYGLLTFHTDDGGQVNMCWIPDGAIHQGVNIGYFALVFLFTFSVFVATAHQIALSKTPESHRSGTRGKTFSILGLLVHLGITWAFALFSQGPLLLTFTYIFTILNSFQGFFLFIYYYKTKRTSEEEKKLQTSSSSSSSNTAPQTVVTSPYT